ncbi:MAG: DUF433 domain-containing protein [Candidatus Margulisiibacteriota bacterium]
MNRDRIEINPKILMGKPVIKGTRIPIYLILNLLSEGRSSEDILNAYPSLTREDIYAALHYGGELAQFEEDTINK